MTLEKFKELLNLEMEPECASLLEERASKEQQANTQRQLYTYAMNETFDLLDMSIYDDERSYEKQIEAFVQLHDKNFDARLNKAEFIEAVNQTLFTLVLEDALKSTDPSTYYSEKTSGKSIENDLIKFFPREDSLIGQKDLLQIVKYFDNNSDGRISRQEIRKAFITNKAKLVEPYKTELSQVVD